MLKLPIKLTVMVLLKSGKEIWNYEIGLPVGSSPAVVDSRIIVGSDDGSVYCFGAGTK